MKRKAKTTKSSTAASKTAKKDEIPTGKSVGKAKVGIYDIFWRYNEKKSSAKSATPRKKKRVVTKRATTTTTKVAKPQTNKSVIGKSVSFPQPEKVLHTEFASSNVQQLTKQLNDLITIVSQNNRCKRQTISSVFSQETPTEGDQIYQAARAKFNTGLTILKTIDPKNPMMRYYKTRNIVWTFKRHPELWGYMVAAVIIIWDFIFIARH